MLGCLSQFYPKQIGEYFNESNAINIKLINNLANNMSTFRNLRYSPNYSQEYAR
jgi:hypothetical protein